MLSDKERAILSELDELKRVNCREYEGTDEYKTVKDLERRGLVIARYELTSTGKRELTK